MKRLGLRPVVALAATALAIGANARGDDSLPAAPEHRSVQEIIVTAQKTEQNVRDVPISMSVMNDEFIAEQSITDYRDLALYVPNAHVDPGNGLFPDINVRGFGSALSNKAFEQSVGLNIDGVPYGRAVYFQGPLFDLQRVELLRGPQGTLFGRNTTAGLMNVVTQKPGDELSGHADLEFGELDRRRLEGAIGGPLVKGWVNFRISGLSDERDGLVANTTAAVVPDANERMNDRDRKALRFQLGFPDLLGVKLNVSYERLDLDFHGIGWEFKLIPERVRPFYRQFDPNTDFDPNNYIGSVDTAEFNRNRVETFLGNASYDLAGWGLDAVAGYSRATVRSLIDDDFGPQPMTFNTSRDDNPQLTFELRSSSPRLPGLFGLASLWGMPLGHSSFIAGAFFQDRKLENSGLTIDINLPVIGQFAALNMSPDGTPLPPLEDFIGAAVPIGNLGVFDTRELHASTTMLFDQDTKNVAGFGQLNWQLADRWELQSGLRFTHESKNANWNRSFSPVTGNAFILLGGEQFTTSRDRSESALTPKASLRYDWNDDFHFYFAWSKGFKAGGFNEQTFNNADQSLEFAAERATAYELGGKLQLLDGTATVNLAIFREVITDFQVLTLPPLSVSTTVVNAGKARAQGVEMDGTWLPTRWLTVVGTLGFNDSEFLSFPLGQCSFDRPDTDGNGDGRCDVTGQPLFRTPKWTTNWVANLRVPISSLISESLLPTPLFRGIDLLGGGTFEYQDVQFLERTYDSRVRQAPFFRFGANAGIGNLGQGWSLRVIVQNLTDTHTSVLIRDVPFGGGNFAKLPEPQRLLFASLQWKF